MVQKKGRKTLFTALSVLGALLLIIAVVAIVRGVSTKPSTDTSSTSKKDEPAVTDKGTSTDTTTPAVPEEKASDSTVDPSQVSTINVDSMLITVSYMKGIGGFEFAVARTASGTRYVQFSSPKLVGTKCTDDTGVFASIIESPAEDEAATLAKKTVVDGTTYGLSLADDSCTADAALLKQYQDAFSQPFSLLKKM